MEVLLQGQWSQEFSEVTFELSPERSEGESLWECRGKVFQAEEMAGAKSLKWELRDRQKEHQDKL